MAALADIVWSAFAAVMTGCLALAGYLALTLWRERGAIIRPWLWEEPRCPVRPPLDAVMLDWITSKAGPPHVKD